MRKSTNLDGIHIEDRRLEDKNWFKIVVSFAWFAEYRKSSISPETGTIYVEVERCLT